MADSPGFRVSLSGSPGILLEGIVQRRIGYSCEVVCDRRGCNDSDHLQNLFLREAGSEEPIE
jgi:hypothetical protein